MALNAPVTATIAPRQAAVDGDVVQNAIRDAGFPEGIDTSTLFRETELSAETPSVGSLLIGQGIKAYDKLGKNITDAIENVNLASGRKMTLTSINGKFLSVDTDAVKTAIAEPEQRAQVLAAFVKLNAALAEPAAATRALLPPPKAPAAAAETPVAQDAVEPAPKTTVPADTKSTTLPAPAAKGATTPPLPLRDLPDDNAALAGVSAHWKKWFAQGKHAPQTLAILLEGKTKASDIEQNLSGALDDVAKKYNIGQPDGPANLEKTIQGMQEAMQKFGYAGQPEGEWGHETERVRNELVQQRNADRTTLDGVTNPVLRGVLRLDEPAAPVVAPKAATTPKLAVKPTAAADSIAPQQFVVPAAAPLPVARQPVAAAVEATAEPQQAAPPVKPTIINEGFDFNVRPFSADGKP